MLKEFLQTQEIEDGCIKAQVCGKKILIDQVLIYDQHGISNEGVMDAANAIIQDANIVLKKIASPNAFIEMNSEVSYA